MKRWARAATALATVAACSAAPATAQAAAVAAPGDSGWSLDYVGVQATPNPYDIWFVGAGSCPAGENAFLAVTGPDGNDTIRADGEVACSPSGRWQHSEMEWYYFQQSDWRVARVQTYTAHFFTDDGESQDTASVD